MSNQDQLRYPIGKFSPQESYSPAEIESFIDRIESFPSRLDQVVNTLSHALLEKPYREGGWTARQVLHHLADSHMNAYIRFKWTLTEETPVIKAYDEGAWAETAETSTDPVLSIQLLKALHSKWVTLLKRITPAQRKRTFIHPETKKHVSLERMMATYAWHGDHHLAHLNIIAGKK